MAEYTNNVAVSIGEIARLSFNDVMNDDVDFVAELVCPVEFLPILADCITQAYQEYQSGKANQKYANNTNKELS